MTKTLNICSGLLATFLGLNSALASFDANNRSINATAETLPTNASEIGFASLSYGVNNNLMITIPTLPLLVGAVSIGAKYSHPLTPRIKIAPAANVGYFAEMLSWGLGVTGSFELDNNNIISAAATFVHNTASATSFNSSTDTSSSSKVETINLFESGSKSFAASLNFDHYTAAGNLLYVGAIGLFPYIGFTWAFDKVHIGLLETTLIIPAPYIYWRF